MKRQSDSIAEREAAELERVAHEHRLHALVVGGRARERGHDVHLEDPGLERLVDEHVEAVDLEGRRAGRPRALGADHLRLQRDERLDDGVLYPRHHEVAVNVRGLDWAK